MKSRRLLTVASVLVLGLSVGIARAEEAYHVFLQMEGFPGFHAHSEVAGEYVADWIEVLAFSDGVSAPMSTDGRRGKVIAEEIVVRKRVDQSAPLFYNALNRGETIPSATFHFFGLNVEQGNQIQFYSVTLNTVRVSGVRTTYEQGVGLVQEIRLVPRSLTWYYFGQGGATEAQSPNYAIF